jgi:putative MATE family efflux protein
MTMAIIVRDKQFYRTLLTLSIPIVLQNLITFGVTFADNVMIGSLGENAISGVYAANQVQTLLQLFVLGIVSAMQIISTQYWGKKDTSSVKSIAAIAFRFVIALTVALWLATLFFPQQILSVFTNDAAVIAAGAKFLKFVCYSYLFFGISQWLIAVMRSVATVKIGLYVSMTTLLLVIFLNWVLIFGNLGMPALGIEGSAIANLICRIVEATIMVMYIAFVDKKLHLKLKDLLRRDKGLLRDYFKYGVPVIAGQVVWAINNLTQGAIIGHLGREAMAAVSITNMLYRLLFMSTLGVATAVGIITGMTIGRGETEKMKLYAKTVQLMFLAAGVISGGLVLLLMNPFLGLYNISGGTLVLGRQFMTILAVTIVGTCYQGTCLGGLVKAGGDTSFVFINDTIFIFLLVLPSALIAANIFHSPAWIVFACLKCDEVSKCLVAVVKINRFKWMKNLTRARTPEPELAKAD